MTVLAKIKINNCPEISEGFEVVTNDYGSLWHYGNYPKEEDAERVAAESEDRFVIEVIGTEDEIE